MNSPSPNQSVLLGILLDRHEPASARSLEEGLIQSGMAETLTELLEELRDSSLKVGSEAIWMLAEFQRRCGLESVISWLDLGISLTQCRGALGLRYFKESPLILGVIDDEASREALLKLTLELADGSSDIAPNCALEFLKKAPELLLEVPSSELSTWAQIGMELAQWDYVLGNEFFHESHSIAHAIPQDLVRSWISFGMKLVTKNSLGKTDYVGTIEYFRSSPSILQEIPSDELKKWVIDLGATLADESPEVAITFLADCPRLLLALPSDDWRLRILKYGLLIADRDAQTTVAYLARASEIHQIAGESDEAIAVFENWFRGGMEVLEYNVEAARAYFAFETKNALQAVEQSLQGVPLRQIARTLKLFAQGMCGTDVSIEPLPENAILSASTETHTKPCRAQVSADGKTIYLPSLIRQSLSREENIRLYTVMTAHEAGHLEFGTYHVAMSQLRNLRTIVHTRYSKNDGGDDDRVCKSLGDLFALYPQKKVIQDLWEILEDARVEFLLQHEYPGLREDLALLTREAVKTRSFLHGMTVREIVLDALLLRFAGEQSGIGEQEDLRQVVAQTWELAKTILHPQATAEDAIQIADQIYQILDEAVASLSKSEQPELTQQEQEEGTDIGAGPRAAEDMGDEYRPITNFAYRGTMDPDLVEGQSDEGNGASSSEMSSDHQSGQSEQGQPSLQQSATRNQASKSTHEQEPGQSLHEYGATPMEQWLDMKGTQRDHRYSENGKSDHMLYDEWDGTLYDYRPRWCRVGEQMGKEGSSEFVDNTLSSYAQEVRLLRKYFEAIRPTALRRLGRQDAGDDIDVDAVVGRIVDKRAGNEPSDRVYLRRERHDRQVAVVFLIDMSGSTARQVGSGSRRVIDIEKEGLILLSEALSAIGDHYALYGYSGQGRGQVDLRVLKDFNDGSLSRTALRIGGITPLQQNRDGAAIRHATYRLLQQPARTRLLVLISDGKPLDDAYGDEYALEDTKMALRETRLKGIHPFCITIDQTAGDYLARMYGEVGFLVIDDVTTLPTRLPAMYQRLTT